MTISRVLPIALTGSTPEGGWTYELSPEDSLHTLIYIETDEGAWGLGSVYTSYDLVKASLGLLTPHLIGAPATEPGQLVEKLHQVTFWQGRGGAVTHAISGISIALWDLFGKVTGQPLYKLLGGAYRRRIKPYGSILMANDGSMERKIEDARARGFRALKVGWGAFGRESRRRDEQLVKNARRGLGDEALLMVDAGGSDTYWAGSFKWARETAIMLSHYDVYWFEEPLAPDDLDGYRRLTATAPLPIASCEVFTRRQSFFPWIDQRAVDIVQPDVTKVGGVAESLRIAWRAYDAGIRYIGHGWNTAVGLAADLHIAASIPDCDLVEYITPAPYIEDLVRAPFQLDDQGTLSVPEAPGLGLEWDWSGIARYSPQPLPQELAALSKHES
jgi:L-alanine-DL-glutamate epimerase-like enolase superfamily enzyme